ncbi:MAG TPA: proprotein convertase P-domain-containing protein [Ignavibacteria bacterium]|nr:hypothetical protein [Bacteroidota bacterium]HRI84529.1 proprotein convertase P-domain-containing protein [Ignavibacteria bacterium]HRJ99382.1 proprotein convertase P-domain-containing protein [Ignavibacteria bacterium]
MKKAFLIFVAATMFTVISLDSHAQIFWNNSAVFAGNSSSYMSVPNSTSLNITGSFSVEAWVNPGSLSGSSKGIISKGGTLGTSLRLGVRILTSGRISLLTNGSQRILSRNSSAIQPGNWTHISCTFNSETDTFKIYINGALDTSAFAAGVEPQTNSDSLFVGISGNTTPFNGKLDEVRLWNSELTSNQISSNMRTSLGASGGVYSGLVLSLTFQREFSSGLSSMDFSDFNNHGNFRNVSGSLNSISEVSVIGYNPENTITLNNCIYFPGSTDSYMSGKDTAALNPQNGITLECWIYPLDITTGRIFTKGNAYTFNYTPAGLTAAINGTILSANAQIPFRKWSHIAFTYNSDGRFKFLINGLLVKSGLHSLGTINVNTDSLYIGGGPGGISEFFGYIDEVRITNKSKSISDIQKFVYASLNKNLDPNVIDNNINYSFDGNTFDNNDNGGPKLKFRENAAFSNPGRVTKIPVAPLNQFNENLFSNGFNINQPVRFISDMKILRDSQIVNINTSINNIKLFIGLNHTKLTDLEISLVSPHGDSITVFNNRSTNSSDNNLITIFDDFADSSLLSNRYASFYCKVKPENNMNNVFMNKNAQGKWHLVIKDEAALDSGILYAWGLNFNDADVKNIDLSAYNLIQGFYEPNSNLQTPDTLTVNVRSSSFPFNIVSTAKTQMKSDGECLFSFIPNVSIINGDNYIIELSHRNSINTWSTGISFNFSEAILNIRDSNTLVTGLNLMQVDASPVRHAMYGGDVNKDGIVDVSDALLIENDALNFASGYIVTDLTGDNFTDASDAAIADNNSANFISVILP